MRAVTKTALLFIPSLALCQADTYRLSYDGLALPSKAKSSSPLLPLLAKEVATMLGSNLLEAGLGPGEINELPLDVGCVTLPKSHEEHVPGTKCSTDFATAGFSFSILIGVYMPEDGSVEEKSPDEQNSTQGQAVPAALRVDVTLTARKDSLSAKDMLTNAVPVLDKAIGVASSPSSFWTIERRPSLLEMRQGTYQIPDEASIDKRVLSSPEKISRTLTTSTRNQGDASSSSLDIWGYKEANNKHEVTLDLFMNSTLRATTNAASQAHAEAMVHPALIAHPYPYRVAVISDAPLAFVRELMKYNGKQGSLDIHIVGADLQTVEVTRKLMPSLDDCSNMAHAADSCMESANITLFEEQVDEWMDALLDDIDPSHYDECVEDDNYPNLVCAPPPLFDVILLDVSRDRKHHYLSSEFHKKLKRLLNIESILVINDGSEPAVDVNFEIASNNAIRDSFLSKATIDESLGGIGYKYTFVYDEVSGIKLKDLLHAIILLVCFLSLKKLL